MTLAPSFPWLTDLALNLVRRVRTAFARSRTKPVAAPKPRPAHDPDKDRVMLARAFEGRLSAHLRRDIGVDGR